MNKNIREFTQMLRGDGLRLVSLDRTGKGHYKAVIEAANNKRMVYILANSTSDRRSMLNCKTDIARFFNN